MKENQQQFTPSFSLLKPSAKALYLNIGTFLGLFAISLVFNIFSNFSESGSSTRLLFDIIGFAAGIIIAPAFVIAQLQSAKGKQVELTETIQKGLPLVIRMFLLQLAILFIVVVGLILLIVPGVFAAQRLLLAQYFLVDKDLSVGDALKESFAKTKEFSGPVWGIIGVNLAFFLLVFTIIGIPVAIGLIIAYMIAPAIRYFEIQKASKAKS
jgi:hypothetical protein